MMAPSGRAISRVRSLLAVVPDAIERSDQIVQNQQRSIGQLSDVDRTTEIIAIVVPALGERIGIPGNVTIVIEERDHHAGTDRYGAIPRAMLGREYRALIFLWKHGAGVEDETEVRCMSGLFDLRKHHIGRRGLVLVLNGPCPAAAIPREAEILAGIGDAIQFARGLLVAHAVNLIVVGPERLVLGVEVHADRIAQPDRIDFAVLAVAVHADDPAHPNLAVKVEFLLGGDVVGLAELNIELVVGTDPADTRGVVIALLGFRDQLTLRDHGTGDDVRTLVEEFGRRIFQHPILLRELKETILRKTNAVGYFLRQGRRELLDLISDAAARAVGHYPDFRFARPHEGRDALRADGDMARVRHQSIERDVEARRHFDLGQVLFDLIGLSAGLRDFWPLSRAARPVRCTPCFEGPR